MRKERRSHVDNKHSTIGRAKDVKTDRKEKKEKAREKEGKERESIVVKNTK